MTGAKSNPIVYLAKKTWEYSKGNRKNVVLYVILFILGNIVDFFVPLVIGKILNVIQESGISQDNFLSLIGYLSLFLILPFVFWIFHGPARVLERTNSFIVRSTYKKHLIDGTMSLPAQWHTDHHSGDTIDKIEKGTDGLYRFSSSTFEIIEAIVRLVGSYFALVYFNLHASYIVLFIIIITLGLIVKYDRFLIKLYKQLNWAENRISAKIFDIISNITTVIILRVEKLVSNAIYKKIMYPFSLFRYTQKMSEFKWFLVSMLSALMMFLTLASYVYFNLKTGTTVLVGTIFVLYRYVDRISGIFFRFAYKYGDIVKQRTRVANAEEISKEFADKTKTKQIKLNKWKKMEIKNLNFSYHDDNKDMHLKNVNMEINRKERIALVGVSGSGKTTVLKIIREMYEPNQIELYLDGKLVKDDFKTISSNIALIPQDPEIFSTTIKDNITLGVQHNLKYIRKFTNMANFTEVVNRLPRKWNSNIVEKGVNLSGGEKQRLALARGLMACENKEIVLLDEPTSSVDSKNELEIYTKVFNKFKTKTILSSIHRLHLLHLFDKIYLFKKGKIIDSGTFQSLLRTSPEFKKMWDKYNKTKKDEERLR